MAKRDRLIEVGGIHVKPLLFLPKLPNAKAEPGTFDIFGHCTSPAGFCIDDRRPSIRSADRRHPVHYVAFQEGRNGAFGAAPH